MSWGRSSDGNSKQGHLSRKQCQEVNCSHSAQYRKAPGKFVQLTIYSVQLLSCVLLFSIPWTAACHYVLNPRKSKLPWKIPSHRSEWPLSKNQKRIRVAEDGGKRELSYTLSGGVNGCRNYQNQQGGSFSTKHPEPHGLTIPSLAQTQRKSEFTVTRAPLFSGQLDWQWPRTRIVTG